MRAGVCSNFIRGFWLAFFPDSDPRSRIRNCLLEFHAFAESVSETCFDVWRIAAIRLAVSVKC